MGDTLPEIVIPDREAFKAAEVCELLHVQPYVLRSWENEFREMGVAKAPGAPRVYRRSDVELAVRVRQLVFGEGLTLAGARRRLESERQAGSPEEALLDFGPTSPAPATSGAASLDDEKRAALRSVRDGLKGLLSMLDSGHGERPDESHAATGAGNEGPAVPTERSKKRGRKAG